MHMVCEAVGRIRNDKTVLAGHLEGWVAFHQDGFLGKDELSFGCIKLRRFQDIHKWE